MDIWIAVDPQNASKAFQVLHDFGFSTLELSPQLFLEENRMIRMGVPPFRIEVLTSISGVDFEQCYAERVIDDIDGVEVSIIGLRHLKENKKASSRLKDLSDIEHLP